MDEGGNYFKLKPDVNELHQWGIATPRPATAVRGTSYNTNPFNYRDPQGYVIYAYLSHTFVT